MTSFLLISFLFIITLSVISVFLMLFVKYRSDRLFRSITNFESYAVVLEYHMNRAFDIIYKDKLLIYSIEATKVNDSQFNAIAKQFVNLVLKLIGDTLKNEFIFVYGSEDTLYFNILEYFNTRYENDEIHKAATDDLINNEDSQATNLFGEKHE